jgi:hypothetical protein
MANIYVYSGAAGAGTGADWANACTTLTAGFTAGAAGDTFYVAHDHSESTGAAVTLSCKGTAATPSMILCVPPVSADLRTTGAIAMTATSNSLTITNVGYWYGLIFTAGTAATNSSIVVDTSSYLKSCKFILGGSSASSAIAIGGTITNCGVTWDNCTVKFAAVGHKIQPANGHLTWVNTASAVDGTGSIPTNLITHATRSTRLDIVGVDLSAASGTLVSAPAVSSEVYFKNCKLHASATKSATPTVIGASSVFVNCDSGATNYINEKYSYEGTLTTETTIIKTGGASDGTTGFSHKVVTTANAEWSAPFECMTIPVWNDTTGSAVTVTVDGVWDGATLPTTDEVWMDVEYLGSALTPVSSFATTTKADILATGAAGTASTATWTTTGLAAPGKFKLTTSVTPELKGFIYVTIKVAKVSATLYIDPEVTLS